MPELCGWDLSGINARPTNNVLFLQLLLNIKQDSRLRGNDGELTVSGS